jgi:hypothetical protein
MAAIEENGEPCRGIQRGHKRLVKLRVDQRLGNTSLLDVPLTVSLSI